MIKINDLVVSYPQANGKTTTVLNHINLTIRQGESIAVMGPNGSGKTTFARCLNALLMPTAGQVWVDGMPTSDENCWIDIRRRVGMVFQNPDNQIVSSTIEREIAFGLENLGVPYEKMQQLVEICLEQFNLQSYRKKTPHYLSGGEKQRLAIASVMAMTPTYLILDEPTSLLDPRGRKDILNIVTNLHANPNKKKMTTLLITQFAEETLQSDRLLIFHKGEILFDDTPANVFKNSNALLEIGLEPPIKVLFDLLKDRLPDVIQKSGGILSGLSKGARKND